MVIVNVIDNNTYNCMGFVKTKVDTEVFVLEKEYPNNSRWELTATYKEDIEILNSVGFGFFNMELTEEIKNEIKEAINEYRATKQSK